MGGKAIFGLFIIMILALSGCSMFIEEIPAGEGETCSPAANVVSQNLQDAAEPSAGEQAGTTTEALAENTETKPADTEGAGTTANAAPATSTGDASGATGSIPVRTYTEGDLVLIKLTATDEDGDTVTFSFTEPLDENGEWQTEVGDVGDHTVTVTASDGKSESSRQLILRILAANRAPVISGVTDMIVDAGQKIMLEPVVTDADGDDIIITYSGWMSTSTYTTKRGDEGQHDVVISATDGKSTVQKTIRITVNKVNHAPVIANLEPITVIEGDTVEVEPKATDEDGDTLVFTYGQPLDENGQWVTDGDDIGSHVSTVSVTDGEMTDSTTVTITVVAANSPPVIILEDVRIELNEEHDIVDGQDVYFFPEHELELKPVVTDADGDATTVSYSGWMSQATKTVTSEDGSSQGVEHEVTATASDGKAQASKTIKVTVVLNHLPKWNFDI